MDERKSTRIQQPPVRINSNLMKIKMEEDYNPIIAPKTEPLEKNEIKPGDEVQRQELLSKVKCKMGGNFQIKISSV